MTTHNDISYISFHKIDCRLKGIYKFIRKEKYSRARILIIKTITQFQKVTETEADTTFMSHVIDVLYHTLVEINLKNYNGGHDRIRDLHYEILNRTMTYFEKEIE